MSFQQYAYPMRLALRLSPGLLVAVAAVHLMVMVGVAFSPLPDLVVGALTLLLFLSYQRMFDQACRRIELLWSNEGYWSGVVGSTIFGDASLLPSSVSTRYAIFLHFQTLDGPNLYTVVPRDSLSPDQFRRLRVRLQTDATGNLPEAPGQ